MRLIDGDALIKYCNGNPFITDSVKSYIRISVATMPTIEERKGKWILDDEQDPSEIFNGNYRYICSECGKKDIHARTQEVPFCWHCGAKMEGVENG